MMDMNELTPEQREELHAEAIDELWDAALDWIIGHADLLNEKAEGGCELSATLLEAMDAWTVTMPDVEDDDAIESSVREKLDALARTAR
jgi:hypothetical protein